MTPEPIQRKECLSEFASHGYCWLRERVSVTEMTLQYCRCNLRIESSLMHIHIPHNVEPTVL